MGTFKFGHNHHVYAANRIIHGHANVHCLSDLGRGIPKSLALLVILLGIASGFVAKSQQRPPLPDYTGVFAKTDVMIPMRDGVRLHTEIYVPKDSTQPLPFLFERTPYGLRDDDKGFSRNFSIYQELVPEGYIFVFQDIRGRYKSEGQFVMLRRPRDLRCPKPSMRAPTLTTPSTGC